MKYAVTIYHRTIEITGPHKEIRLGGGRVRAHYRCGSDTYHVVRVSGRRVDDALIANNVISHAQSLGFRGMDVVRLVPSRQRAKPVSDRQLGLFDIGDGDNA